MLRQIDSRKSNLYFITEKKISMDSEKKGNILWVDDEIELLRSHVLFLKEKGYEVETATNGEDAIELVHRRMLGAGNIE